MMKKLALLLLTFWCSAVWAQEELHIHHINVEDGDATLIGIYDVAAQHYKRTILIDGGASNPKELLLPYLRGLSATQVNYVVLTHYHKDHYNGLLALKDGSLRADSVSILAATSRPKAPQQCSLPHPGSTRSIRPSRRVL